MSKLLTIIRVQVHNKDTGVIVSRDILWDDLFSSVVSVIKILCYIKENLEFAAEETNKE